jgi:hypothetical protein
VGFIPPSAGGSFFAALERKGTAIHGVVRDLANRQCGIAAARTFKRAVSSRGNPAGATRRARGETGQRGTIPGSMSTKIALL